MLDYIIVTVLVIAALAYTVITLYKKYKRLSTDPTGGCGHKCDCCPFAKYNGGKALCNNPNAHKKQKAQKKSRNSCCCG